jgi:uncharacterized protein with HEPN domain
MRPPEEWVGDILNAIERIEEQAKRGRQTFDSDPLVQIWMQHHIMMIGEAASQLGHYPEFYEKYPDVEWRGMRAMRNILTHEYFRVDLDEVWDTIQNSLPVTKVALKKILGE